jgi:hypothetical protein
MVRMADDNTRMRVTLGAARLWCVAVGGELLMLVLGMLGAGIAPGHARRRFCAGIAVHLPDVEVMTAVCLQCSCSGENG